MAKEATMNKKLASLLASLGLGGLLAFNGCAAMGGAMQVAGTLTGQQSLSDAGKSVSRVDEVQNFTPEEKYYTGRTVAAQLLVTEKPSDDLKLEAYVGRVGNCMALASGMGDLPHGWHFILLDDPEAGAFACPGGTIFITSGLVKLCQTEDELAGVLAHEISHIALNHPMDAISAANKKAALGSLAEFGLAEATKGRDTSGALAQSFDGVVKEVGQAVTNGYDKDKESQADLNAVTMLVETGYDPRGLKRVLLRLRSGDRAHGDPKSRAAAVEAAAADAEPVPEQLASRTARFKSEVH
jgi:predicted Zn-dependent protease